MIEIVSFLHFIVLSIVGEGHLRRLIVQLVVGGGQTDKNDVIDDQSSVLLMILAINPSNRLSFWLINEFLI